MVFRSFLWSFMFHYAFRFITRRASRPELMSFTRLGNFHDFDIFRKK